MDDKLIGSTVAILTAIIGVAIIAALISKNAQTPQVLQAGGNAFSSILKAALSPITGGSSSIGQNINFNGSTGVGNLTYS
jgi:hypothetical protein